MARPDRGSLVAGLIFVGLGVIFLAERLGLIDVSGNYIWPILLIALGLSLLLGGDRGSAGDGFPEAQRRRPGQTTPPRTRAEEPAGQTEVPPAWPPAPAPTDAPPARESENRPASESGDQTA